jgi:hypothetical protein
MLILNMFIYKTLYDTNEFFFSRYHCCLNVSNNENSNAILVKLLYIFVELKLVNPIFIKKGKMAKEVLGLTSNQRD